MSQILSGLSLHRETGCHLESHVVFGARGSRLDHNATGLERERGPLSAGHRLDKLRALASAMTAGMYLNCQTVKAAGRGKQLQAYQRDFLAICF